MKIYERATLGSARDAQCLYNQFIVTLAQQIGNVS